MGKGLVVKETYWVRVGFLVRGLCAGPFSGQTPNPDSQNECSLTRVFWEVAN